MRRKKSGSLFLRKFIFRFVNGLFDTISRGHEENLQLSSGEKRRSSSYVRIDCLMCGRREVKKKKQPHGVISDEPDTRQEIV